MAHLPLEEIANPYVFEFPDYQENVIRITINWDPTDGDLLSAVAYRDSACVYTKIYVGMSDTDGTVDNTPDQWTVPSGETLIRANLLKKARLRNIHDILDTQVTAGP